MPTRKRAGAGRDRTSQLMVEIRGSVKQADAAKLVGLNQSRISRAEQGTFTLDPEVADAYARALGASGDQRRELVKLCEAAKATSITGQARLIRRGAAIQEKVRDLEAQSPIIRSWQPEIVPGLLQTWDYTLAVIEREPDEAWTRARRERLALLEDPDREFHQLLSEATLRWVIGSREVMAEQLRHLIDLSRRPNVTIGILAFGAPMPPPPSAFHLYGDRAAEAGTDAGTTFLEERPDLAMYRMLFDRLDQIALHADAARKLMAAIESDFR